MCLALEDRRRSNIIITSSSSSISSTRPTATRQVLQPLIDIVRTHIINHSRQSPQLLVVVPVPTQRNTRTKCQICKRVQVHYNIKLISTSRNSKHNHNSNSNNTHIKQQAIKQLNNPARSRLRTTTICITNSP
jgi:hypothetical protein